MKNLVFALVLLISGIGFSQSTKPVLEAEGQLVKATYHYDNGSIQQVGYFKDGKLDGKWMAYDESGALTSIAEYSNGIKSGKWIYYTNNVAVREVDFSNNQIVAIKKGNQNAVALKN